MNDLKKPRAPRMVELFAKYSHRTKEVFIHSGLVGNVEYGKTNVLGESRSHPVVKILDGDIVVLEIHREKEYAPRTKVYVEGYSDKLDSYMEALERTIGVLETGNRKRIDEDNKRRAELQIYENNLF